MRPGSRWANAAPVRRRERRQNIWLLLPRALLLCGHHRFRGRPQVIVRAEKRPSRLLVDAGAVHLTGIDGADILIHVEEEEFRARGTTLALSGVPVLVLGRVPA